MRVKVQQKQRQKHFNRQIPAAARLIQCVWSVSVSGPVQGIILFSSLTPLLGDVTLPTKQETAKQHGSFTSDRSVLTGLHTFIVSSGRYFCFRKLPQHSLSIGKESPEVSARGREASISRLFRKQTATRAGWQWNKIKIPYFPLLVLGLNWAGRCYNPSHLWIL